MSPEVRPARPDDRDGIGRIVEAAFADQGPTVAQLVETLRATGEARVELVAVVEDAVLAHVMLSRSWVDARRGLVEVLVLSPLSVDPEQQGRGVGTTLLAAAVRAAEESGAPMVFLEGSPTYYGERGWLRASELGFDPPSDRIPEPAFQVMPFPAREGWMTGRLVYCQPFWELDCVGLRDPLLAELEERFDET